MQLAEEGIFLKPYKEMPKLYEDLGIVWEAFWTLMNSRQQTFGGVGPIPFSQISEYIRFRGIKNVEVQDKLIENLLILDNEYLKTTVPKKEEDKDGDRHGDDRDGNHRDAGGDRSGGS